jgi:hypothetical protein
MSSFTEVQKFFSVSEHLIALNPSLSNDERDLVLYYSDEVKKTFNHTESEISDLAAQLSLDFRGSRAGRS